MSARRKRGDLRAFESLSDLVAYWQEELLLSGWTIKVRCVRSKRHATATCRAEPEYQCATVTFNLLKLPPWQHDAITAHECLHCYTEPLAMYAYRWAGKDRHRKEDVRRAEEGLTEAFTRVVMALAGRPWIGSAPPAEDSATRPGKARSGVGSSGRTPTAAPRARARPGNERAKRRRPRRGT